MRRVLILTATVAAALVIYAGAAFAQSVGCQLEGGYGYCEGTPEADLITGSAYPDRIYARGGADVVHALAGDDELNGEAGPDKLYGEGDTDNLFGGTGADSLYEGDNPNSDWLGAQICGGSGDDRLYGGPDSDRYEFGHQWGKDTVAGEAADGSGDDVLEFSMFGAQTECGERSGLSDFALTIDLPAGRAYETPAGPSGANTVSFVGSRIEEVNGGAYNDTIVGNALPNTLSGEDGDDTINAGRGDDRIIESSPYDSGDDTINAGRGNDNVYANHAPYLDQDSDTVDCGPGDQDTARVDDHDTTINCESVTIDNEPNS
jgi:Ca2+-binding RTX toxin-like protein